MTIKVYPSPMPGEPIETHEWAGTFGGWLKSKGIVYDASQPQPIELFVSGIRIPPADWEHVPLLAGDDVEVRLLPAGGIFKGIGNIIGKIFNAVFGWLLPGGRGGQDYRSPEQGRQLQASQARANQAKLGDVVPELAGRFRRFPDYLTPPRRHFVNRREQWLEFHACIGPGEYLINDQDVKVGDTPFISMGEDAEYQIFPPGADLSAISTHEHWHTVEEVGGTSSGTAGLELSTDLANRTNEDPSSYDFDGNVVARSAGTFPGGWGEGSVVLIEYPREYNVQTVTVNPPGADPYQISEITGWFGHVDPVVNQTVRVGTIWNYTAYRIMSVMPVSSGVYTIQLFTDLPENNIPVVFPPDPAAEMIFGANIERTLIAVSTMSFTISGSLFFETGTVAGARIFWWAGTAYGEWSNEFYGTPGAEVATDYELDIFAPQGIAYIEDDGELYSRTVEVEYQYRDVAGGAPTTIRRSYTDNTLDGIGFTERFTLPAARYAWRVRRASAESTATNIRDTVHWYGLKSRLRTRTSYPNWTTMSVKLRSGGKLAAQSENQINLVATRILPTLQPDGSWGTPVATRDITAFARYILQSIGYTDAQLDIDEWLRLHNLWTSRGDTFDHVYDLTTVKEALNVAFRAGMGEFTLSDGLIRPVREGVRTQFEHAYSPQNMTSPLRRTFKARRPGDADGVEVEYTDEDTWTQKFVVCALPSSQRLKLVKVRLQGVTSRVRAWRFGMREARKLRYRAWQYAFSTPTDALNSEYLSYVPLLDDTPGFGRSSLMYAITGTPEETEIQASEPFEFESGQSYVVGFRSLEGRLVGPFPAQPGPTRFTVRTAVPANLWPNITLDAELPHVYFGPLNRWCYPALITNINPQSLYDVSVAAVNYDVRVYADDDGTPHD